MRRGLHPRPRDWMAEFKGKAKLTESEVNLMKGRLNSGRLKLRQIPRRGYGLSQAQSNKGLIWLRKHWREMRHRELIACGIYANSLGAALHAGKRDRPKLKWKSMKSVKVRLVTFYMGDPSRFPYPVYKVSCGGRSFSYYVKFGKIEWYG